MIDDMTQEERAAYAAHKKEYGAEFELRLFRAWRRRYVQAVFWHRIAWVLMVAICSLLLIWKP